MKVVILQPSYIPWRGYFHQIQKADVFVFYDCVQYDERGWRNRNKIKTPDGPRWLTVPVSSRGSQIAQIPIRSIPIVWDAAWSAKHLKALQMNYCNTPYFQNYMPLLTEMYSRKDTLLADFTGDTTRMIARTLGITHTQFFRSSDLPAEGAKSERLLSILKHLGATHYISGPSARSYLEVEKFEDAGVSIEFMNYDYPAYPQLFGGFEPQVSVLDLLFNVGSDAPRYIWDVDHIPHKG